MYRLLPLLLVALVIAISWGCGARRMAPFAPHRPDSDFHRSATTNQACTGCHDVAGLQTCQPGCAAGNPRGFLAGQFASTCPPKVRHKKFAALGIHHGGKPPDGARHDVRDCPQRVDADGRASEGVNARRPGSLSTV